MENQKKMEISHQKNASKGGLEGIGRRKLGQEPRHYRRALGVINQNLLAATAYPCLVNKRGLSEKNASSGPPARSRTEESCHEEPKKLKISTRSTKGFEDCIFIDEEEQKEQSSDHPMAMSLGAGETELAEADPMEEEVEMEDIVVEEPIMDIDKSDDKNPLAAADYVEELHDHYRKMEVYSCVAPDYIDQQQSDINSKMRAILIDWLIEVHYKFDLMDETLFLTINLIDRFLSKQAVVRKKLQLVGLVAMLLACKYEEVSVPVVGDLVIISDRAYTRTDVLEMEKLMANKLQFNFSFPTPYVFLKRFLKAAQSDKKMEVMAFFLMELSLVEYEMLRFEPSLLAAAAVYTAQSTLHGCRQWNRTCEWYSQYSEEQLIECSRMMVGFHQNAAVGKLTGVHRKYCSSKFGHIAKCKPAIF